MSPQPDVGRRELAPGVPVAAMAASDTSKRTELENGGNMVRDKSRPDKRGSGRNPYRDNDDVLNPLEGNGRSGGTSDTKSEARGGARENIGNTARGTDANPT